MIGAQAVIDGTVSDSPFLPKSPKEILKSGDYTHNVGVLLGYNKDEGLYFTAEAHKNPSILNTWRSTWVKKLGALTLFGLNIEPNLDKQTKEAILSLIHI